MPAPDPEELLANWEAGRGGGVCFEMTDMLHRLLASLGYRAHPVLAQISFPGSHQAVLVEIDGARYLGDAGNGAPFWEPIPVDRPYEVHHAGLAFRFRPGDAGGTCVQDRFIDGAWQQFFVYDLRPAADAERFEALQRHHTIGESWVVDVPRLVRCEDDGVWALRGDELVRHTDDGKRTERLATPEDYVRAARDAFALPAAPIVEALEAIARRSQVGAQA